MNLHTLDALASWFEKVKEPHFFRKNRTPYLVWICEVTLQQTRIQAALRPLQKFLTIFPTLESLAVSSEEEVLSAFQGLGYYSRARNLRKGAQHIQSHFQGRFPSTYEELLQVPSIGPYTAAAISSICYGEREPSVDGNLKRILARMEKWDLPLSSPELGEKTTQKLKNLFQKTAIHPGDLNEAFMELGQKICLPQKPQCPGCPLQQWCKASLRGETDRYPSPKIKKEKTRVLWKAYILENSTQEVLLQRWEDFYFLKNQWAFPSILLFSDGRVVSSWKGLKSPWEDHPLPPFAHTITHHKIQIQPFLVPLEKMGRKKIPKDSFCWKKQEELPSFLVASALLKIWQRKIREEENQKSSLF